MDTQSKPRPLLRNVLRIALILLAVLVLVTALRLIRGSRTPSAAAGRFLSGIREADDEAMENLLGSEEFRALKQSSPKEAGAARDAFRLYFKDFRYRIEGESRSGSEAEVTVRLTNLDARALAHDLALSLLEENGTITAAGSAAAASSSSQLFTLLQETLETHRYALTDTTASLTLEKTASAWTVTDSGGLADTLSGGLISALADPYLIEPDEVLAPELTSLCAMDAQQWAGYLGREDIFSTYSTLAREIDDAYTQALAAYTSCSIDSTSVDGDEATCLVTVTSIDLTRILESYRSRLLAYADTVESITADSTALSEASARCLLEALREDAVSASRQVTIRLINDGTLWRIDDTGDLADALLGGLDEALTTLRGGV